MALEFHWNDSRRGGAALVGLEDAEYWTVWPAMLELQRRTGMILEQYVKGRLGPEHCGLLADLIVAEALPLTGPIGALVAILRTAAAERRTLVTVPD